MTSYRLKGLDCPTCAGALEEGLRKLEGVSSASVDFGSLSLRIEARDLAAVEAAIPRLEPGVTAERLGGEGRGKGRPGVAPAAGESCGGGEPGSCPSCSSCADSGGQGAAGGGFSLRRELALFGASALVVVLYSATPLGLRLRAAGEPGEAARAAGAADLNCASRAASSSMSACDRSFAIAAGIPTAPMGPSGLG